MNCCDRVPRGRSVVVVSVIRAGAATAPNNTALLKVTGQPAVGTTLPTTTGPWTGSPTPTSTRHCQRCAVGGSYRNNNSKSRRVVACARPPRCSAGR
jgi:hypothetical protein